MLSTGIMILLGKTFGNLMVDVQATNDKLRHRALNIVQAATGLDAAAAEDALQAAGGDAKAAILASRAGIAPELARKRLAAHDGALRAALDATLRDEP
jgi:N-acetylmuramic acid 6-phosphate etherase